MKRLIIILFLLSQPIVGSSATDLLINIVQGNDKIVSTFLRSHISLSSERKALQVAIKSLGDAMLHNDKHRFAKEAQGPDLLLPAAATLLVTIASQTLPTITCSTETNKTIHKTHKDDILTYTTITKKTPRELVRNLSKSGPNTPVMPKKKKEVSSSQTNAPSDENDEFETERNHMGLNSEETPVLHQEPTPHPRPAEPVVDSVEETTGHTIPKTETNRFV